MSIINTNGQPVTSETPAATTPTPTPQRVPLSPAEMQRIIGAYARLKEIQSATIANPRDDAEKQGLINFLNGALLANAEELFGAWVAISQEYTPLIQGFTAILNRALSRIDQRNQAQAAQAAEVVTEAK